MIIHCIYVLVMKSKNDASLLVISSSVTINVGPWGMFVPQGTGWGLIYIHISIRNVSNSLKTSVSSVHSCVVGCKARITEEVIIF